MVKIKKNYRIKTCKICKKKKPIHKNRKTCGVVCARKYRNLPRKLK